MFIQTINPSTGKPIKQYPLMSNEDVKNSIEKTHLAYSDWKNTEFSKRSECLQRIAKQLLAEKKKYASLITEEMGKPIHQAQSEVEKCARLCEHYASHGADYLAPRMIETSYSKSFVTYEPMGIVFAVMPWNFPFWQVFRFAIPNLMSGNACLLKHAAIVTGSALAIETLMEEAGLPKDLFQTVVIEDKQAGLVIEHPYVVGVTLTGSDRAGSIVAGQAGTALKKVVLELGGSDPYIVLQDANLEQAAEAIVRSRMNNAGQVCIAAKRVIIVPQIEQQLKELILHQLEQYVPADPTKESTKLGPLARQDLREKVHQQVQQSIAQGAKLIMGGSLPTEQGFYYPATVLDQVTSDMQAFKEEVFGPVISFVPASDENEAIALANATPYGLAAAIFSQDKAKAEKLAIEKIQAGTVTINDFVTSDPRLPFGGIKSSGFGRELSAEGMRAFVNVKTICIK